MQSKDLIKANHVYLNIIEKIKLIININTYKKFLLCYSILGLILQLLLLKSRVAFESEGWLSDIAYHLNWEFNGCMAKDIPYGITWSSGLGRVFIFVHFLFYKILGVGLFQARFVSFICGICLLAVVFIWTYKYVSKEVSVFSTFLLAMSPVLCTSLPNAREDVMYCLSGLLSFYFISSAVLTRKSKYFTIAGILCAMSIDISYRGIEIIFATYLFHCLFLQRDTFLKCSALLVLGSFIYFVFWLSVSVFIMGGVKNLIVYNLIPAAGDGGAYSIKTLLSEISRFINNLYGRQMIFTSFEILYLATLSIITYKYRARYNKILKILFSWLLIIFITMSIFERQPYLSFLLLYYPLICIIAGISLYELLYNKKIIGYIIFISVIVFSFIFQGGIFTIHAYHKYLKKDFNVNNYYLKLHESVDTSKNILGSTNNWYAFTDSQYYGGDFYLNRVKCILNELKNPNEYKNDHDRTTALLKVLEKRGIEYIIADELIKPCLIEYFTNQEFPQKNFLLTDRITDMFLGRGVKSKKPPYTTEIYKVISYEP